MHNKNTMTKDTYVKPLCTVLQVETAPVMAALSGDYVINGNMDDDQGNDLRYGGDTDQSGHYEVW